jgi:hypothetical protein
MDAICPHKQKVTVQNVLGITSYIHENGVSCIMMNVFSTSAEDVLISRAASIGIVDDKCVVAAYACSSKFRASVYADLSSAKRQDLPKLISTVFTIIGKSKLVSREVLTNEIVQIFGQVLVQNVKMIIGLDISGFRSSQKPAMSMAKVTQKDTSPITSSFVVNRDEQRQRLSDIIVGEQ